MKIPFSPPDITSLEIDEVIDTLKSGWITTGPRQNNLKKNWQHIGNPLGCMPEFCNIGYGAYVKNSGYRRRR